MTDWQLLLDHVGCGAWPFLRGGMICVVNFFNERDPIPLIRFAEQWLWRPKCKTNPKNTICS